MFNKRGITIKVDPKDKDQTPPTPVDPEAFKKKAEFVLHKLERSGAKVFAGICIYVILDTRRKVAVAKAENPDYNR
jgi:hypothetical protein